MADPEQPRFEPFRNLGITKEEAERRWERIKEMGTNVTPFTDEQYERVMDAMYWLDTGADDAPDLPSPEQAQQAP